MEQKEKLLFVIYDSIFNSVFQSQVLAPLQNRLKENPDLEINIMTFEKERLRLKHTLSICYDPKINFIIKKKSLFFGRLSLAIPLYQLKKFLKQSDISEVIARGPLAGYIAKKAIKSLGKKTKLTIQARGLAAEELRYANQFKKENFLRKIINTIRYKQLRKIEQLAYGSNLNENIEAVSEELKSYLTKNFNSKDQQISIATKDIPSKFNTKLVEQWRDEVRKELNIPKEKKVFVYSGSARPWQCIPETLEYFKKEHAKDNNNYLLILSQDKKEIEETVNNIQLKNNSFKILSINPDNLHKYLSASDAGLLFRHKDIINWISRPTKMLEYQSVGLKIIHNNTIKCLSK